METFLRLGALFFEHLQCIGPAVVNNDDARGAAAEVVPGIPEVEVLLEHQSAE